MTDATFTVGQLAAELGVTTRTLRFYEEAGIVTPRSARSSTCTTRNRERTGRSDACCPPSSGSAPISSRARSNSRARSRRWTT